MGKTKKPYNYQIQELKKLYGKDVDINITPEEAQKKIDVAKKEKELSKKSNSLKANNLESVGWFDRWLEDD